jgi:CBS domain-containing protein
MHQDDMFVLWFRARFAARFARNARAPEPGLSQGPQSALRNWHVDCWSIHVVTKVGMLPAAEVRDVMSEALVFVGARMPAAEAAEILIRHRINGAPVLGDHGRVVGVVSKTDLIDPRRARQDNAHLVEDLMTRVLFAVRARDPVMQAVRLMVEEDIHRALVVNDDGTLAGIVAPMDILRALLKGTPVAAAGTDPVKFVDLQKLKDGLRLPGHP